ncbi:MAG: sigma-54 dependent transcriptional regulator, partial [Paracoccaceae bacterium]|nr:sigma-54 dependent transcriptional regulator [Paracoccaceae bacterium]
MSNILIVDDERDIRELISDILADEGYETRLAGSSEECMGALVASPPSLLILDIWLKDSHMDGIDILKIAKRDHPEVPVVIISGHGNIEIAVAAIKQGAYDFIEKPFNIDQLLVIVQRAMETAKLRRENLSLKQRDLVSTEMIGETPSFRNFVAELDKVAKANSRVLLTGASGAGKELAARYLHKNSTRSAGAFVTVNCASIQPDLMEPLLFGREHSGGSVELGLLEQADGGVVFFDEIADLPFGTQSKILKALVDQTFNRVDGTVEIQVDFRVISATSTDLEAEIDSGTFRRELFHRLNVVGIAVPSLQERREDIPLLVKYFIQNLHEVQGLALRPLSDEASAAMQTMVWSGNIRQLKNLTERVLLLGHSSGPIGADELPKSAIINNKEGQVGLSGTLITLPLREAREAFEREYLLTQINR